MPIIEPQPGPQTQFLSSSADICIYGGGAGGGKSFALLLEPTRHLRNPGFGAVIFRRTFPEIRAEGGMWDETYHIYPHLQGISKEGNLEWHFPSGARITFAHMQHEQDRFKWQGSQICLICFDELTHFSMEQVFYMLSRNRSTCGVKPYVRGTTNPDPDSWVKKFLAPWVDENWQGKRAESGELRYFIRDAGQIVWLEHKEDHPDAKSVSFIRASVYDNKILLTRNPEYLINLKALPLVDRERLLAGNWSIRLEGGMYFKKAWFPILAVRPGDIEAEVRFWDLAASEEPKRGRSDPDYTASVHLARRKEGAFPRYIVLHATWDRKSPGGVEQLIKSTARLDDGCYEDEQECLIHSRYVQIVLEEEGASSGKHTSFNYATKVLEGFLFEAQRPQGSKETRAKIASAQAQYGNIGLLQGQWNDGFLDFLEVFPNPKVHDDVVDGLSGAMNWLYLEHTGPRAWSPDVPPEPVEVRLPEAKDERALQLVEVKYRSSEEGFWIDGEGV